MNGVDAIKELFERENVMNYTVSRYLGERTQDLNQQLELQDLKVERFAQIAAAVGYRVDLVKVGYKRVSREYIDGLLNLGSTRNLNERSKRAALFYTTQGGFTAVDNRMGKMIRMDFQTESDLMENLALLTGVQRDG